MAAGNRCSMCGDTWPAASEYRTCPRCGERTDRMAGDSVKPMSAAEARSVRLQYEFARYYEETRGVPVDTEGDPAMDPYRQALDETANIPDPPGDPL